ncbi:Probable protein phosphatase 2C 34 [Linum perenne]
MVLFPSFFNGLARTVSMKKGKPASDEKDSGKEAAEELAKDAKRNELILSSSGTVKSSSSKSNNFASVCSRRGQKGVNQDCLVVWESLLCNWQETLKASIDTEMELGLNDHHPHDHRHRFEIWKESFLKTYAAVDQQLKHHPKIDAFSSGSTALTIVKQGEHLMIANVGDSRAVLATTSENGGVSAVQLTVDCKPNLPQEAERIKNSKGRIFCLPDEPGVYRIWRPSGKTPGLALSRAFGDYCIKEFGLISTPEVTQLRITESDQFVILATDGVWDVVSNQEAVRVVSAAAANSNREKAAKRLVEFAARAWKRKRSGIALDDMSAICLFFHRIDDGGDGGQQQVVESSMIVSALGDRDDEDDLVKKNGLD